MRGGSERDQDSDPAGHRLLGPERRTQFHTHANRGQTSRREGCSRFNATIDKYVFTSAGSKFSK